MIQLKKKKNKNRIKSRSRPVKIHKTGILKIVSVNESITVQTISIPFTQPQRHSPLHLRKYRPFQDPRLHHSSLAAAALARSQARYPPLAHRSRWSQSSPPSQHRVLRRSSSSDGRSPCHDERPGGYGDPPWPRSRAWAAPWVDH